MALEQLDNTPGADKWAAQGYPKINAAIAALNNFIGGTVGQIWRKGSATDFEGGFVDFESFLPTKTGNGKNTIRVKGDESGFEVVKFVDIGYMEINSGRAEGSGTPHIDSEATIFTITTPNDGVTRDYHIVLTSVITALGTYSFGYNSYFKIGVTFLSSNRCDISPDDRISYTHNAVLTAVPPNTAILIRDERAAGTTGLVDKSKLTYMGFAN